MTAETTALVPLEERRLALEERALALRERELANQDRANRSPAEVAFDLEMRQAKSLAASPFLPEKVGKNDNERVAAAWGVLRFAQMLAVDPYVLAQQIYVVHGRVGFSASFLIGLVNERAGLKRRIAWTSTGAGKALSVTCTATDSDGAERTVTMTMEQVDRWGWASKPGEPWKADPELMLRYRTATQLIRLYFAGAVMGLTTSSEELRDVYDVAQPSEPARRVAIDVPGEVKRIAEAQPLDIEPNAERKSDPLPTGPTDEERAAIERGEREQAARDAAARTAAAEDEGTP